MVRRRNLLLRPKPTAEEQLPESVQTPAPASRTSCPPATPSTADEQTRSSPTAPIPTAGLPSPSASGPIPIAEPLSATAPTPADTQPAISYQLPAGGMWPSHIAQGTSTMWLLPPHSDQSSAITGLLRTEIQSHNITREMLHTTEQRRLEAVHARDQLVRDSHTWAAAYNNLTTALHKCSEEFSRLSAEHVALKAQMQGFNGQTLYPPDAELDAFDSRNQQFQPFGSSSDQSSGMAVDNEEPCTWTTEDEMAYSPCPYSPDM